MSGRPGDGVVIIGAGQAGYQVATSLRMNGYERPVTLVGDEPLLPYQRPPLSKEYLTSAPGLIGLDFADADHYHGSEIRLIQADPAVSVTPTTHTVRLASGRSLPYEQLVLATGASARTLSLPGHSLAGVCTLRTRADADVLRASLAGAAAVVVVGGGFVGLEFASVARDRGLQVTVLESGQAVMTRVLSGHTSRFVSGCHHNRGVDVRTSVQVAEFVGSEGRFAAVRLTTGEVIRADLAIVSVGAAPNVELAVAAGLATDDGIVVDEFLQTDDRSIFAIGDCARYPTGFAPGTVRLESVQNAIDQARCVADALTGSAAAYSAVPWFWTNQAGLKVQIAGLSAGHDSVVVRESGQPGRFSVFCYSGGRLIAVESVDRPADHMVARRLLAARIPVPPEVAADTDFELKQFLRS